MQFAQVQIRLVYIYGGGGGGGSLLQEQQFGTVLSI